MSPYMSGYSLMSRINIELNAKRGVHNLILISWLLFISALGDHYSG